MKQSRRRFVKNSLWLSLAGMGLVPGAGLAGKPESDGSPAQAVSTRTGSSFAPPYVSLHKSGELRARGQQLWSIMEACELCPRRCRVNRLKGERGFCQASSRLVIASHHPHFGEEDPLVGTGGSGTVFFSNCLCLMHA